VGSDGSARMVDRTSERRIGAREGRATTGGRLIGSVLPGGESGSVRGDLIPKDSVGTILPASGESGSIGSFLPASGESGYTFLPASGESGGSLGTVLPSSGESGYRGGLLPTSGESGSLGTVLPASGESGYRGGLPPKDSVVTVLLAFWGSGSMCWLGSSCNLPVRAVRVWILDMMGRAGLAQGGIWTCACIGIGGTQVSMRRGHGWGDRALRGNRRSKAVKGTV
jgi:hypothetical protein